MQLVRNIQFLIQSNQSNNTHLKNINQSINVEWRTCDTNSKDMYSCFDESKKFLDLSMYRGMCQLE